MSKTSSVKEIHYFKNENEQQSILTLSDDSKLSFSETKYALLDALKGQDSITSDNNR